MNMNQSGFPQFPQSGGAGQGQPGTASGFGLSGGIQNLQNLGGQQFPQGLQGQMQGRPGGLGGLGQGGAGLGQPQQQQQRMGGGGLGAGLQLNLGAAAGRMGGVPGQQQQQYGATVNGMQGMRLNAPGGLNPGSYQSMQQQQPAGVGQQQQSMQQQGLPGRPGAPLSPLGNLGGPGVGNLTGFQQQQQQQQQRVGGVGVGGSMGGGGLAGLPRGAGGIGGVGGGAGTYSNPPSGDLMSILNKAGGGMGGRQEEGPPSFNAADFPSLSSAGQSGGRHSSQDGANETFAALLNSQKGPGGMMGGQVGQQGAPFGDEDFPALPGAGLGGGGGGRQDGAAGAAQLHQLQQQMGVADQFENLRLQQQQQQQRLLQQQQQQQQQGVGLGMKQPPASPGGAKPGTTGPDRFGLLGLLSVIRMTDPDVTTLALGTDLTTLGLNLNSPEALWKTFASPWADGAGKPEPDFRTPNCYLTPPPRLTPAYFGRFQPDTLFYIFYGMPGDEAQVYAADELSNRGWYYHKELKTWLTRAPNTEPLQKTDRFERGAFFLFDPSVWEVVKKNDFTVAFEALERPSGLLKSAAAGGGVAGGPPPPQGAMPVPAK
jgi:CCR4-NOT transcription complex subunit 2